MGVKLNTYYVRNKDKTIILETTDINEAISRANRLYKAYVLDKFGNRIHVSTMPSKDEEIVDKSDGPTPRDVRNLGDTVFLNNVFLYKSSTSAMPIGRVSGTRYLYDAQLINGRYRICKSTSHCVAGISFIEGYINAKDIKSV